MLQANKVYYDIGKISKQRKTLYGPQQICCRIKCFILYRGCEIRVYDMHLLKVNVNTKFLNDVIQMWI